MLSKQTSLNYNSVEIFHYESKFVKLPLSTYTYVRTHTHAALFQQSRHLITIQCTLSKTYYSEQVAAVVSFYNTNHINTRNFISLL